MNEKKVAEQLLEKSRIDAKNIYKSIKIIARYNYYVLAYDNDTNYKSIVTHMEATCPDFSEIGYSDFIEASIKRVTKGMWKIVDYIPITKSELEFIKSLNNIKKEKIAFVLLADAKFNNAFNSLRTNKSYLSLSDLFSQAKVSMPVFQRSMFMNFIYEDKLVADNSRFWENGYCLSFVDYHSEEVLRLYDYNFENLAYTYLNWKCGGYKRCKQCGSLFKVSKNQQYCRKCTAKDNELKTKEFFCADCGKLVIIKSKNNKSYRCEGCQAEHDKQVKLDSWRKSANYSN